MTAITDANASKTLVFSDKHISINLPTLKASARYENAKGGLPSTRPVEHWEVLEEIQRSFVEIVGQKEFNIIQEPIFAYEGSALRLNWARDNDPLQCPTSNYLLQRILTKITFPWIGEGNKNLEGDMSIAVGYHEKGIDIAFGPNIRVCSNLNIFGGKLLSTYGTKGQSTPWDKIIAVIRGWFHEFRQTSISDFGMITRLKQTPINYEKVVHLIGHAYIRARAKNKGLDRGEWMSESMVGQLTDFIYSKREAIQTAWDLTQAGTTLLKPGKGDMMTLLKANRNFNDFVIEAVDFTEHN